MHKATCRLLPIIFVLSVSKMSLAGEDRPTVTVEIIEVPVEDEEIEVVEIDVEAVNTKLDASPMRMGQRWLALTQEADGRWNAAKHGGSKDHDVMATSLALLAFLGDGNSSYFGKYKRNVKAARDWLLKQQKEDGSFGNMANTTTALFALAESYGMEEGSGAEDDHSVKMLRETVEKTLAYMAKEQLPSGNWKPTAANPGLDTAELTFLAACGMKSTIVAGIEFETDGGYKGIFESINAYTATAAQSDKTIHAVSKGAAVPEKIPAETQRLAALLMMRRQMAGVPKDDPIIQACLKISVTRLPKAEAPDTLFSYAQSLGFFHSVWHWPTGRPEENAAREKRVQYWRRFSAASRPALLSTVVKDKEHPTSAFWSAENDPNGKLWGRVGQTALNVLRLEVYWRYTSVHKMKK